MFKIKHTGIIMCAVCSVILAGGVAIKSFADTKKTSNDFGPPQKMTTEELKMTKESIGVISNEFGEFRRVSSAESFMASEVAYSKDSINVQTKELVLDYGIFVKVSESITKPDLEVKSPDGGIISLSQVSEDKPGPELDKIAETPIVVAPGSDISIHLKVAQEVSSIVLRKNVIDGAWEGAPDSIPVKDSIKVPKENGTFIIELETGIKSGRTVHYFFAVDVR